MDDQNYFVIREIATEAFNWMKRLSFKEVGKNIQ